MKHQSLLLSALAFAALSCFPATSAAVGDVYSFTEVWALVTKGDPSLKAADEDYLAAKTGADRASRHWFPHVYAQGRIFSTNDAAGNFVYTLQQRDIQATDFAPSSLNRPGSHFFQQGTLGVDLPLFEGGMRFAQVQAAGKGAEAKGLEAVANRNSEYAKVAQDYAALLALAEEAKQLEELRAGVEAVLGSYSIGSKSNPVGYSGLLGLKNLKNRIEALRAQNAAAAQARRESVQAMAQGMGEGWRTSTQRTKEFLGTAFPVRTAAPGVVPAVAAARLGAESMDKAKNAELARYLPQLGAFAQGDLYAGSRSSATSYTAGAYLRWNLFSATDYGAMGQAGHQAAAAHARADQMEAAMGSARRSSATAVESINQTLVLLDESAELLQEQTRTARQLFRSGSISALQLAEVLNRRADLIGNRRDAEIQLAAAAASLYVTSATEGVQ